MAASETLSRLFKSNVGAVACAKIAPVFGSITITVPLLAREDLTTSAMALDATH